MATFSVTSSHTYTFQAGWGVYVAHAWDEDTNRITDIDVSVVRIAASTVTVISDGTPCIRMGTNDYAPVEVFEDVPDLTVDDSHDLRCRWFRTKREAQQHADSVRSLWEHPNPWTAFCRL